MLQSESWKADLCLDTLLQLIALAVHLLEDDEEKVCWSFVAAKALKLTESLGPAQIFQKMNPVSLTSTSNVQ